MTSMSISLTPALLHIVQQKVESGLYNNASEVIREAIRQFDTNQELLYQLKLSHLREALSEGVQQVKKREFGKYSLKDLIFELNAEGDSGG
jgi:antitoxin ParD1/3/4